MAEFVILANGEFPRRHLDMLKNASCRIACDGAAETMLAHGILPDWIAGDLDSLSPDICKQYADRIVHEAEQETNDLNKAFRCAMRHMTANDRLTILGATGKREDHTLGNISLLADFAELHENIRLMTDTGVFIPLLRSGSFETLPGQQVSLFNPGGGSLRISGTGFKYPVCDLELRRWWTATLNTAVGTHCTLSFASGSVLVFLAT